MSSNMDRWFVGHTLARKEQLAQENLQRQGFRVFAPSIVSERRHARKIARIRTALFPRYIFVQLDLQRDRWRSVNGTRGMSHLLTNDEGPCPTPLGLVEALQECVGPDGCVSWGPDMRPGDQVRVALGTLTGQVGELLRLDGRERVEVLLSFFGASVRVRIARDCLELAG